MIYDARLQKVVRAAYLLHLQEAEQQGFIIPAKSLAEQIVSVLKSMKGSKIGGIPTFEDGKLKANIEIMIGFGADFAPSIKN